MQNQSKYKRLAGDTLIMTIGQFSSKLLSFFLVPLYTYILTTKEYGTYDLISVTISLLIPLLTCVIFEGVLRFCLDSRYDNKSILTIGTIFCLIGTFFTILLYPFLSFIEELKEYYLWLVIMFFCSSFETTLTQYLKGTNRIKLYSISGIVSTIVHIGLNLLFLLCLRMGLFGYIYATIISKLLVIFFICLKIRFFRNVKNPLKIEKKTYSDLLRYTAPMMPNSLCWWISNSSDKYMLNWMVGTSIVGIYSVAYKIPSILSIMITIFMSAFQISAIKDFGSEESKVFFSKVYRFFTVSIVAVSSLIILLSKYLGLFLYQKDFFEAWKCSVILIIAFAFNSLSSMLGTVYTSSKKTSFLFYSTIVAAVVNIVSNFFFINALGMYGAALATLLSYFSVWLLRIIHSESIFSFDKNIVFSFLLFTILLCEGGLVILDSRVSFLAATFLCIMIFVLSIIEIKKVGFIAAVKKTIKVLLNRKRRLI